MFGVGTDYIVFLLFRYREHVSEGDQPKGALLYSLTKVGEVIASAAATVMAAFAALLVASLESLRTLAPGLIVGIALMLLAALTLVPAILSLLGINLFWPTKPAMRTSTRRTRSERIGDMVARHPAIVLTTWVVVLAALAFGALGFKTTYNQLAELPASTPSQVAYNTMASAFPAGYLGPTQVFVISDTSAPLNQADVNALASKLSTTQGVSKVLPPQYTTSGGQALINVLLTDDPYAVSAINDVAGPVRTTADATAVSGATTLVGGTTSQLVDVRTALRHDIKHVFPLALGIVAVILALLLRALIAPIYLLIGVVLTYVATLGVITLVFINGFGFVGLDFTIPIIVYLFVMAIGTDYNILIASRLREGLEEGLPPRDVPGGHRARLSGRGLGLTDPGRYLRLAPSHRHPAPRGDRIGRGPRCTACGKRLGHPNRHHLGRSPGVSLLVASSGPQEDGSQHRRAGGRARPRRVAASTRLSLPTLRSRSAR